MQLCIASLFRLTEHRDLSGTLQQYNRAGRSLFSAAVFFYLILSLGATAYAQRGSAPNQAAACTSSVVAGLDPQGPGFLSVRSGPGPQYPVIDKLRNGEPVRSCSTRGTWAAITYGPSLSTRGWANRNWLVAADTAPQPSSRNDGQTSRAPGASGAHLSVAGSRSEKAVVFREANVRDVLPVTRENRLLVGYPILFGKHQGETVQLRHRKLPSSIVSLGLFLDLAILKQWPEILDDPRIAYFYADRFLTGDLANRYITDCPSDCRSDLPLYGWRGINEFEREAAYRSFRSTIVPRLTREAPAIPVSMRRVLEMELRPYDSTRQGFPLALRRPTANWDTYFGTFGSARKLRIEDDYKLPPMIAVPRDKAQAFLSKIPGGSRYVYLALDQRLDEPGWHIDSGGPRLRVVVERARLFSDPDLRSQLLEFASESGTEIAQLPGASTPARQMKVETWRGARVIGGRVAAVTTGGLPPSRERPDGIDQVQHAGNLVRLVRDYALADKSGLLDHDQTALDLIDALDGPLKIEIVEEALQRPLGEAERKSLEAGLRSWRNLQAPVLSRTFIEQRALDAIRARASRFVPRDLPRQPIPLRVYCFVDLERYDPARQSFGLGMNSCNDPIRGIPGDIAGLNVRPAGSMPDRLVLPPDKAEQLSALSQGSSRLTLSFETELTVRVDQTEAGFTRTASLSPRSNFWLHRPSEFSRGLFPLTESRPVADGGARRQWDLRKPEERLALLNMAGAGQSLPADGRALLAASGSPIGFVIGEGNPTRSPGSQSLVGELFVAAGMADLRNPLANALGIPREHLLNMAFMNQGENDPIAGIYAILPAPAESYSRRACHDAYGQSQIRYRSVLDITSVQRFDTSRGRPVLVLTVEPREAQFITGPGRPASTLETFDLRAPVTLPDYEALDVFARVRQLLQSAGALKIEPQDLVRNVMRWPPGLDVFERENRVQQLVRVGQANNEPIDTFWVAGSMKMGEYDFRTGSFRPREVLLGTIDVLRAMDVPAEAVRLELSNTAAFDIRMPVEAARNWAASHPPNTELQLRALVRAVGATPERTSVRFKIDVLEAELLEKGATVAVRDSARVLFRFAALPKIEAAPPPPVAAPAPQVQAAPARTFDIVGARLSDPLDQALSKIQAELGETGRYGVSREQFSANPRISAWETFATATLVHDPKGGSVIIVYSEPPTAGNVVTAVSRSQKFAPGQRPQVKALTELLRQKYGAPVEGSRPERGTLAWKSGATGSAGSGGPAPQRSATCNPSVSLSTAAVGINLARMEFDRGVAPPWFDGAGARWKPPVHSPDLRQIFAGMQECDEDLVMAWFFDDGAGQATELHVVLGRPAEVSRLRSRNEAATSRGAAEGKAVPDIKL